MAKSPGPAARPFVKGANGGFVGVAANHGGSFSSAVLYRMAHELLCERYSEIGCVCAALGLVSQLTVLPMRARAERLHQKTFAVIGTFAGRLDDRSELGGNFRFFIDSWKSLP
jgi:hypothetical protein